MPSLGRGLLPLVRRLAQLRKLRFAKRYTKTNSPRPRERQCLKPGTWQGATAFPKCLSLGRLLGIFVIFITPCGRELERILCRLFATSNLFAKSSPSSLRSLACGLASNLFVSSKRKKRKTENGF